jgi:hypothetical protein
MSFNTFVSLLKLKHVALNVALAKSVPWYTISSEV